MQDWVPAEFLMDAAEFLMGAAEWEMGGKGEGKEGRFGGSDKQCEFVKMKKLSIILVAIFLIVISLSQKSFHLRR
ncbi:MAG: hypothetical protein CV087_23040 [Candidatus Brocadia sp. WS118]|nr:MAG: hypothetical protein CV087_23040 [Candidatus Brocadia sp. WS118]